jgi:hypothetical protein
VLSTHPAVDERIRDSLAYPVAPGTAFKPLEIDWAKVKESLPAAAKAEP